MTGNISTDSKEKHMDNKTVSVLNTLQEELTRCQGCVQKYQDRLDSGQYNDYTETVETLSFYEGKVESLKNTIEMLKTV